METIFEIQRIKQIVKEEKLNTHIIRSPEDAADVARQFIGDDDREVMFVMCLNQRNNVIAVHRAHIGSINTTVVHPREIFKTAILNNAVSIIISHQHPSRNTMPSKQDIDMTKRIVDEIGRAHV